MKIEIELDEILKAISLIENEWGEGSWAEDLPGMHRIALRNADRYDEINRASSDLKSGSGNERCHLPTLQAADRMRRRLGT